MCKYCENEQEVINTFKFSGCSLEVFIDEDNTLCINTYNHSTDYTEDIFENLKIYHCPMCGKKLD